MAPDWDTVFSVSDYCSVIMVSRGHIELFHAKTFFFIPPFPFFLFLNLFSWTGFYCRLKGGPFHVKSQSHNCYDYEVFAQQQPAVTLGPMSQHPVVDDFVINLP